MTDLMQRQEQSPQWDPFRLMNELMRWPMTDSRSSAMFAPDFEVKETENAYLIQADLPGVKEEDINITVSGNQLTVSGKREASREEGDERYYIYERRFGSFTRSFTLPAEANVESIEAELDNGVLALTVPKSPGAAPKKISLKDRVKQALSK